MKKIEEILENSAIFKHMIFVTGMHCALIHLPDSGTASICWGYNEDGWEHVSVAPAHKFRIPTWNDMAFVKDIFFNDDEEAYQIMPPKSEYVNIKENCLHLWAVKGGRKLCELLEKE